MHHTAQYFVTQLSMCVSYWVRTDAVSLAAIRRRRFTEQKMLDAVDHLTLCGVQLADEASSWAVVLEPKKRAEFVLSLVGATQLCRFACERYDDATLQVFEQTGSRCLARISAAVHFGQRTVNETPFQ